MFSQASVCPQGDMVLALPIRVGTQLPLPHTWTWDTTGYGSQAGGTHPTRMFSCSIDFQSYPVLDRNIYTQKYKTSTLQLSLPVLIE